MEGIDEVIKLVKEQINNAKSAEYFFDFKMMLDCSNEAKRDKETFEKIEEMLIKIKTK